MKILVGYFFPTIIEKKKVITKIFHKSFSLRRTIFRLKKFYFNDYNDLVHEDFSGLLLMQKKGRLKH